MARLYSDPFPLSPALPPKISISSSSPLVLRTPSLILRTHPLSFATISAKRISSNTFRAAYYVYPDPIPEFAESEIQKFRAEILKKLSKDKEAFRDNLVRVVDVCSQIFSDSCTRNMEDLKHYWRSHSLIC